MKRVWKIEIVPSLESNEEPYLASGYVLARSPEEVAQALSYPERLVIYECHKDKLWPGAPEECIDWGQEPLSHFIQTHDPKTQWRYVPDPRLDKNGEFLTVE